MNNILVAVPNTGNIRVELAERLLNLPKGVGVYLSHKRPIDTNRNHIVKMFLETGREYLIMIDSDIAPCNNFLDLVKNKVDVCTGDICTVRGREVIRLAMKKVENGYRYEPIGGGLIEVDALGTGMMCIHKRVFEKLEKPYFSFRYNKEGELINGEDFDFCERVKELGFKIYFDTRLKGYHYQIIPL